MKESVFNQKVIKIITGIDNFEFVDIIKKVKAAELAEATYVDVAAHPEIVSIAKSVTDLPICVSSIDPIALYNCVLAGADIVEIGNFDPYYRNGIYFSAQQIFNIAEETKKLINNSIICVTIPHTFSLSEQIQLAISLEVLGVNAIQTEGVSFLSQDKNLIVNPESYIFNIASKTSYTLSSTYTLSKVTNLPIISSSGMNSISSPIALTYNAVGVGIGSVLNQFNTIHQMAEYISEISRSFDLYKVNSYCQRYENTKIGMINNFYSILLYE